MKLSPPPNPSVFPERKQVTAALQRAAAKARLIAEQTGTKLIVVAPAPKSTQPEVKPQ
jgi:hypothetical protein